VEEQPRIRVGLVDDHGSVRSAVQTLLAEAGDLAVVGEAESVEEAGELVSASRPDVLLLDLGLRDGVSLSSIPALLARGAPELKIVILTMNEDPGFRRAALEAGASDYLLKDSPPDELIAAVRDAAGGDER
jgi:DNA-binding NarL/FixJ family response regulator